MIRRAGRANARSICRNGRADSGRRCVETRRPGCAAASPRRSVDVARGPGGCGASVRPLVADGANHRRRHARVRVEGAAHAAVTAPRPRRARRRNAGASLPGRRARGIERPFRARGARATASTGGRSDPPIPVILCMWSTFITPRAAARRERRCASTIRDGREPVAHVGGSCPTQLVRACSDRRRGREVSGQAPWCRRLGEVARPPCRTTVAVPPASVATTGQPLRAPRSRRRVSPRSPMSGGMRRTAPSQRPMSRWKPRNRHEAAIPSSPASCFDAARDPARRRR